MIRLVSDIASSPSTSDGFPVDPSPAARPGRRIVEGHTISLCPLDAIAHGESLFNASRDPALAALWHYLPYGPFVDRTSFDVDLAAKAASADPLYSAIVERASGDAAGSGGL